MRPVSNAQAIPCPILEARTDHSIHQVVRLRRIPHRLLAHPLHSEPSHLPDFTAFIGLVMHSDPLTGGRSRAAGRRPMTID